MLNRLFTFFTNRRASARAAAEQRDFQALEELAPVKGTVPPPAPPSEQPGNHTGLGEERSVICREAVLNREQRVAGYEFILRKGMRDRLHIPSRRIHHIYNEVVIRNLLHFSINKLLGHRQAFITVLDSFLANPLIDQLPGPGIVLTVMPLDAAGDTPDALGERVLALKQQGFQFALEECFEGRHFEMLAPHASHFIFRTAQRNPAETQKIADQISQRYRDAQLIARDLESFDDFELCRTLNFALFQGPFVTSREDWTDNRAGPQTLHICDLLNHLRRDAETTQLVELLKQDAMLSYRLLRYINSAAMGLRQTVTSIEHALVLIGRQNMYRWLTLLLFGSAQNSPYAAALQETALARGRFMELIGERAFAKAERDSLFITGLFSMLDRVLRMPLPEAIKPLHLAEWVEAALLRGEGPYAPFLDLAMACESSDQDRIEAAAASCGIEITDVNAKHFEALAWVQSVEY
ncbi:MAG: HDOD domain-containing protein [Candidatus Competibacter sp.]|nr:HDOD domain-containing protein [Candidatus Competibacter sp.]